MAAQSPSGLENQLESNVEEDTDSLVATASEEEGLKDVRQKATQLCTTDYSMNNRKCLMAAKMSDSDS